MPFSIRPHRRFPVQGSVTGNVGPLLNLLLAYCLGSGLLITLLLLSSGPAYADWVEIRETDYGMTVYADPFIIHSRVNRVKMWELYDYNTIQTIAGDSFLSSKSQHEYDCEEDLDRLVVFTRLSGNMGSGAVVFSNSDEQEWEPVQPNSIGQTLWTFACGKE